MNRIDRLARDDSAERLDASLPFLSGRPKIPCKDVLGTLVRHFEDAPRWPTREATSKNEPFATRAEADVREKAFAKELRKKGFAVWYG